MRSFHGTLTAADPHTVDFATVDGPQDIELVEVVCREAGELFFTIDGSVPTVAREDTYLVVGPGSFSVRAGGRPKVQVISSGALSFSVLGYADEDLPDGG